MFIDWNWAMWLIGLVLTFEYSFYYILVIAILVVLSLVLCFVFINFVLKELFDFSWTRNSASFAIDKQNWHLLLITIICLIHWKCWCYFSKLKFLISEFPRILSLLSKLLNDSSVYEGIIPVECPYANNWLASFFLR